MEKDFQEMKITIGKNRHYPWLIPIGFPFWVGRKKTSIRTAKFMFTESCMFDLKDEDQWDVNKLFGFSIGHHHHTSFRFGWRPLLKENLVEIVAYEYHDSKRQKTIPFHKVELNKWYEYTIMYDPIKKQIHYLVSAGGFQRHDLSIKRKWGLGYTLGIYFGGNEKAPQNITIFKRK
jgi:hypothetical protein